MYKTHIDIPNSLKEYYMNISSKNISILTDTWGWFIDIDPHQNDIDKNSINNNKNTPINKNKFLFFKNKIQIYRDNAHILYNKVTQNANKITDNNINNKKRLKTTPSISRKLSDLELQFTMDIDIDPDDCQEKIIEQNNIYNKLIHGFCLVTIILLLVG
jgi:hypothetical protein